MQSELKNNFLHLYPTTIAEFNDAHLFVQLNNPVRIYIHRPLHSLAELNALINSNTHNASTAITWDDSKLS